MERRRGEKSDPRNILGPARTGLLLEDGPRPGVLSAELLGAEQSGNKRTDKASAKSAPWHLAPVEPDESERTKGDSAISSESQTDPPDKIFSISASPPRGETFIPRASAPASTGGLLPYSDAQKCELLSARGVCPGTTQGSGTLVCTNGVSGDPLGG